jgi:23S rRNA (uracil1939-C5)-methyltransferase
MRVSGMGVRTRTVPRCEFDVQRFSQLGEGVASWEGRSVFIDGAIAGEHVLVDVEPNAKVARGTLIQVLKPSPHRRAPVCPLAGRCGGCDWQHVQESEQRRAKLEIVLSALEHVAGLSRASLEVAEMLSSPRALGYRRRAVLHFHGDRLALHERRSHASVDLDGCPALVPRLELVPGKLAPKLLPIAKDVNDVHLLAEGEDASFALFLKTRTLTDKHLRTAEEAVRALAFRGAVLTATSGGPHLIGRPAIRTFSPLRPEVPVFLRPDAFSQANSEGNAGLVAAAVTMLGARENESLLELFSGNGNFTFALAGTARQVLGVESSAVSLDLARRSVQEGSVTNVRFIQGDAEKVCKGLVSEGVQFDRLLADPPRTGMPNLARFAQALAVKTVVYVACDAAALARDTRSLKEQGYVPQRLQVVDMFPQTRHVEALLSFQRS